MAVQLDSSTYLRADSAAAAIAPLTLACWFRVPSPLSQTGALISLSKGAWNDNYFLLSILPEQKVRAVARSGNPVRAESTNLYAQNTWHHAAAVFSPAGGIKVYLDGVLGETTPLTASPIDLDTTAIGTVIRPIGWTPFNGDIAEAAVWKSALSQENITNLAAGYAPHAISEQRAELVMHHRLIRAGSNSRIGIDLTHVGSVGSAEHPRAFSPRGVWVQPDLTTPLGPYRIAQTFVSADGSEGSSLHVAGVECGAVSTLAEVHS